MISSVPLMLHVVCMANTCNEKIMTDTTNSSAHVLRVNLIIVSPKHRGGVGQGWVPNLGMLDYDIR